MTRHSDTSSHGTSRCGIVFERLGKGTPIVLIHGWCLSSKMWTYAQEALAGNFEVITVDLAGFGKAAGMRGPYTISRHADDLADLLEELDVSGALLAGFAFGAAVALEVAARANVRVAAVVSVAIPTAKSSPYEKMPKAMRRDWPDFAQRSAKALFHNPQSQATISWLERMFGGTALHVALEAVDALAAYDPLETLDKVGVPVLFLHADQDTVAPVWLGEACAGKTKAGRLRVIADCGHLIVLDQKTAFHEEVKAFASEMLLAG